MFFCLSVAFFVCISAASDAAVGKADPQKKTGYTMGIFFRAGSGLDAQYRVMFKDLLDAFSAEEKIKFELIAYSEQDEFMADVKNGRLDFAMSIRMDPVYLMSKSGLMKPLFTITSFGKHTFRYCIYAKKGEQEKKTPALKGLKMATYEDMSAYYYLRKITHVQPEEFFEMSTSPNASSAVYMLGLDDTDSIFLADFNIEYFKLTNPGPVKNIVEVECSPEIPNVPMFVSKKTPPEIAEKVVDYCMKMDKLEALKKYRPLFRMIRARAQPVSEKDYAPLVAVYDEARKAGWNKGYDKWIKYQKQK